MSPDGFYLADTFMFLLMTKFLETQALDFHISRKCLQVAIFGWQFWKKHGQKSGEIMKQLCLPLYFVFYDIF